MVPSTKSGRKIQIGFDTYQTNSDNIREMSNHSPIIRIRIEESIF
jgi:hypothetical protein